MPDPIKLPLRISYAAMLLTLVGAAWLDLALLLLTILFSFLALERLTFRGRKSVAILLFFVLVLAAGYGFYYFFHQALQTFPRIAEKSIPAVIKFASEHELNLPFTDLESLRVLALDTVMEQIRYLGSQATSFGKQLVLLVIGIVVAVSLFLNRKIELDRERAPGDNLYSLSCDQIVERFTTFYRSFSTVMGAQILISAINTCLTAIFIVWISLPYAGLVIAVTFLCGLLPIIGNILSNIVIVSIAFTLSPMLGLVSFGFLVALHKLEYFLNSQIIGSRTKNPMWLTLLALVVAERIMGIPGMILAPVLLHYLRAESSQIRLGSPIPAPNRTLEMV